MEKLTKVTISENQSIAQQVFLLRFPRFFEFKAGQFIGITINDKIVPRLYSIASSPADAQVAILYQVKDDGQLTPRLNQLKAGATIWVTPVQGKFIFEGESAWWIATGTGIAPFYSMFLNNQYPQKLIQGGRKKEDIFFRNDFIKLSDYIVCCTQDKGDGIFNGRLTEYLKNCNNLPEHIKYYLCGSAEMVVDVRNLLIERGVDFHQIITEIYF